MEEILSWKEIEQKYHDHWVQLIDFEWEEGEPRPIRGKVRISAPTRREFNKLVLDSPPANAARIYVGAHSLPDGIILSSNLTKIIPCES